MVKKKMDRFKVLLLDYLEDFLIFMGLLLIMLATFLLNSIAGIYATGIILFLLGVYFIRFPIKKGR
ncbi:hypothetical protein [Desulfitobacterium sp. PCE1]|uniref:hypothetical protein n=1 Tax=Desulfitobacterium sp. PCE1 TaxID=146907 RepID=UPI000377591C|nr:hypothetical protein [Desulfitobacterium sp. PCE1]